MSLVLKIIKDHLELINHFKIKLLLLIKAGLRYTHIYGIHLSGSNEELLSMGVTLMKKIYTFIYVYINMNLVFFLLSVFLMPVDKVNTEIYMYTNTGILI